MATANPMMASLNRRSSFVEDLYTFRSAVHTFVFEWPRCAEARRRIRGQERMLVILLLPVLMLIALGIREITTQGTQIASMDRVQQMVSLATDLSGLLDQTQVERGATSVFLSSEGQTFVQNMLTQRRNTDAALKQLYTTVDRVSLSDITGKPHFNAVIDYANQLADMRDTILLLNITVDEALGFYTAMDAEILGCISDISKEVDHSTISRLVMAYWAFGEVKEFAGQERAIGAQGVNTKGWVNYQRSSRFSSVVLTQDTLLEVFDSFAPAHYLKYYDRLLGPSEPVVQITGAMRAALLMNDTIAIAQIDSNAWFYNMTAKLNIMKKVQSFISEDIKSTAVDVVRAAQVMMAVFGCIFAAIFVFLIQVVRWVIKEIQKMAEAELLALCISEMRLNDVAKPPPKPTPLQAVMYHIVENLRTYRPYLPDTLFAGNEDEEEAEDQEDTPLVALDVSSGEELVGNRGMTILNADRKIVPVTTSVISRDLPHRPSTYSSVSGALTSSRPGKSTGPASDTKSGVTSRSGGAMTTGSGGKGSTGSHTMAQAIAKRRRVRCEISERVATVLVADVTGFHQLCSLEQLDDLYGYHTKYITAVEEIVKANKGVVHRFTGDKVFCTWNTVAKCASHSQAACKAALEILRKTKDLPSYSPATASAGAIRAPPSVRISVCSGTMYIGNMGSATIQSYTTVGPLITTAHVLNGLNKELSSSILANGGVRKNAGFNFNFRMVDHVVMKGVKSSSQNASADVEMMVFELTGESASSESGADASNDQEWMYQNQSEGGNNNMAFEEGVKAFFQGSFQKAYERFGAHCASHSNDAVADRYRKRAKVLAKTADSHSASQQSQYVRYFIGWNPEGQWGAGASATAHSPKTIGSSPLTVSSSSHANAGATGLDDTRSIHSVSAMDSL